MSDISYRTQTTIIDCNRRHSSQAKSGNNDNPALFTNELGKGIKLNVGDQVSVEAVYVSEVGAGSDTIEIKGQSLGKMRTITIYNSCLCSISTRIAIYGLGWGRRNPNARF